jgi:hypothetical protein
MAKTEVYCFCPIWGHVFAQFFDCSENKWMPPYISPTRIQAVDKVDETRLLQQGRGIVNNSSRMAVPDPVPPGDFT